MKEMLELMEDNKKVRMDIDDENIILVRSIFCAFSLACCLFLMIVYVILCLQRKFNICNKNENRNSNETIESDYSSIDNNKENKNNRKRKIGLGSNFMFLLTTSNFFGSLIEFLFYFYYKKMLLKEKESDRFSIKNYKDINNDNGCKFFGFAHNFWDLSSVCWTTMLTLLFYCSTNLSNEMLYKGKKYLIIGFIYCIISCIIFCGLPLIKNNYGFARFYCSFRYVEFNEINLFEEERISTIIYRWSFILFIAINNLFNAYCLIKTFKFYSKKLTLIKKQNKKEYNLMLIYVWVFRIFPIVLLISRIFKGISRIIIEKLDGEGNVVKNTIEYINAFLFASNGIFDSIACIFFFKGVFWCCSSDSLSQTSSEEKGSNMNYLESEISD